jgi:polyribonucleotide nucleotidyltransferase
LYIKTDIKLHNYTLNIEIGKIARNAASSIFLDVEGTTLLITVVYAQTDDCDFLPLKVEYFERFYANGKIPFNYFKREGKPSEREILIARLIDRSIRAMFPKDLNLEIQITVTVLSINKEINPDILAINGVSIALALSDLPFLPISSVRIGLCNNLVVINPSSSEMKQSFMELVLSGTEDKITMIEGSFNEIKEDILLECLKTGLTEFNNVIKSIQELKIKLKKQEKLKLSNNYDDISNILFNKYEKIFYDLYYNYDKNKVKEFKNTLLTELINEKIYSNNKNLLINILSCIEKKIIRKKIIDTGKRLDSRILNEIRNINSETNILKSTHGSAIFTRGETQSIAVVTLGTHKDLQLIDCPFFSCYKNNFILHYNFPPYAVNEVGNLNVVKRREIGHGNLAKNALNYIIPLYDEFPYVIRVVSEITESNGSSSMATVCSSSLALMDAGVPIKNHVAGIAMGLIKEENDCIILTDISSEEDFFGDMDFKLAKTKNGITALQMDLKVPGITPNLIKNIINEATLATNKLLNIMITLLPKHKEKLSEKAPKIKVLHINKNKIKDIIGKNGSIIKDLTEKYECEINISNDGMIRVSANSQENINLVITDIKNLIKEVKIGTIFRGKVTRIIQFGAFVNIINKTDGLLHISKINKYKTVNPSWEIKEDDVIDVVISNIDTDGKISLNIFE